jgi:hypothetical protein
MSIKYFEIGVAFERSICTKHIMNYQEERVKSSLRFDSHYKLYLSLDEFKNSLKYDYREYIMHNFFYYTIRVRNIYNNTYSLSCKGNIVHYSTIFKPNPYYRKRDKKWKIGWIGSEWRIPRKYKEEYREKISRYLDLEKSIGEMIDKYYKGANIVFRKDMDYY